MLKRYPTRTVKCTSNRPPKQDGGGKVSKVLEAIDLAENNRVKEEENELLQQLLEKEEAERSYKQLRWDLDERMGW